MNLTQAQERLAGQFRNLDRQDPSKWPALPRALLLVVVALAVLGLLWVLWLSSVQETWQAARDREAQLRLEYQNKLGKAMNLEALKKQRAMVAQHVQLLEKQLPSKAEMDAILSDINQAGVGRNLQFELFKPGQYAVKEYYAELPIAIRVTGKFHEVGAFAADIANLPRIVTLNAMSLSPRADGSLTLDATAKTFRYLDADEVTAQRKTAGVKP